MGHEVASINVSCLERWGTRHLVWYIRYVALPYNTNYSNIEKYITPLLS